MAIDDPGDMAEVSSGAAASAAAQVPNSGLAFPQDSTERTREKLDVMKQLWNLYVKHVLPIEEMSHFQHFHNQPMTKQEFLSNPQVLFVGKYSTGKTSMIKWLTGSSSPKFHIGPEPTTNKFMAVVHGDEEQVVDGHAAVRLPQLPYKGLSEFGSHFQAVVLPADILQGISFIDTPGVVARHNEDRDYDFYKVCSWLAERADLVLLTFDASGLDVSDELVRLMEELKPHFNKVRFLLNKLDGVTPSNLMNVYGALNSNLGKVLKTPEITKIFSSSFWGQEYQHKDHAKRFDEDKQAILTEIHALPRTSLMRKIDRLAARIRRVHAHFCIVAHIRSQLPWQTEASRRKWVSAEGRLEELLKEAQRSRGISDGDMLREQDFKELATFEGLHRLPSWDARLADRLRRVEEEDVPALLERVGGVARPAFAAALAEPESLWDRCLKRRRMG